VTWSGGARYGAVISDYALFICGFQRTGTLARGINKSLRARNLNSSVGWRLTTNRLCEVFAPYVNIVAGSDLEEMDANKFGGMLKELGKLAWSKLQGRATQMATKNPKIG